MNLTKVIFSLGYNHLTNECYCLSTFNNQHESIIENRTCKELEKNSTTLYRTSYMDFGNHLDKRRQNQNTTQITIVFFLTVGGRKNLRQIKRLIHAIYSRQHYYLIHVDSVCVLFSSIFVHLKTYVLVQRENYLYDQLLILSKKVSNIHLTNKRYPTTWGASNLLMTHLEAFKQIFDEFKWNFSFILNLSETDFPLK